MSDCGTLRARTTTTTDKIVSVTASIMVRESDVSAREGDAVVRLKAIQKKEEGAQ